MKIPRLLSALLLAASFLPSGLARAATPEKPNIVLIFMDDLGYGDLGCYGATGYTTPHLDALARDGLRFTNFYAAQPVCSASRASLLTGCYANRVGIAFALNLRAKIGLNPDEEIIPELLKPLGYRSAAIGKWHLGFQEKFLPLQQGFDEFTGLPYSNDMWPVKYDGTHVTAPPGQPPRVELALIEGNRQTREFRSLEDQEAITTLYTERATEFIRRHRHQPFFLYLAHTMPHVPLAVSAKFKGKSRQGLFGDVMMEIDWSVGEVLRTLDDCGLTDNTLVIFTSDNGPWLNYGNHAGSTAGLREGKGNTYEGGTRVPCLVKWPGHVPAGKVSSALACTIDILPTLCAITGAALPRKPIDGVDLSPILAGDPQAEPRDHLFFYYRENSLEAVRQGTWKLVFPHPGRTYEGFAPGKDRFPGETNENFPFPGGLYDLRRDPGERYDVSAENPEIVKRLETLADTARADLGDDLTGAPGKNRRAPGRID